MIKAVINVMLKTIMLLQTITVFVMMMATLKIMEQIVCARLASMKMLVSVLLVLWVVLLVPVLLSALIVILIKLKDRVKASASALLVNILMVLINASNVLKRLTFARNVMLVLHA